MKKYIFSMIITNRSDGVKSQYEEYYDQEDRRNFAYEEWIRVARTLCPNFKEHKNNICYGNGIISKECIYIHNDVLFFEIMKYDLETEGR